ncbi:NAD(P)/FAD-dependent oxidoreductase [Teichococcus vastitatis]|uniref:FAD-dependent oxidoreductase n=1 Tax=Teichococcus vastitatis TaxID=2307076 RepID=A0ABS9W0U8_9PROT|nr:FAD-dependent oxidoreductase [Pseudoroseomonas vastitatis]MCI0752924.1 FAD-dependent oxidoreductase [Pseudoroseomonas vastitatis]
MSDAVSLPTRSPEAEAQQPSRHKDELARIVIVGGGAGGVQLATRLGNRHAVHRRAEVLLIDRDAAHLWKPLLHEVAAGTLDVGQQQLGFVVQAKRHGFRYLPGEMVGVDRTAREVLLAPLLDATGAEVLGPRRVSYDVLVLAIGSQANDFGIPGVREHCHFIDSRRQAEAFNEALRMDTIRCLSDQDGETLDVAVVGAGATGVELSAEIGTALDLAAGYGFPGLRDRLRLTLIETAPRILGALPERVAEASRRELERQGVQVLTGAQVTAVDEAGLQLKDGRHIRARLKVWAAGVAAPAVLRTIEGLEFARTGQVVTRSTLQAKGDDWIFVIGDCGWLIPEGAERPLGATAQVAQQQAVHLARALSGFLDGQPVPGFRYQHRGALVAIGHYNAFGSLGRRGLLGGGTFIQGRLAQLSYASLYRRHQLGLHGFWRSLLIWAADALHRASAPRVRLE